MMLKTTLLVIYFFCLAKENVCGECTGNYCQKGDREIRLFNEKKTFVEAQLACSRWGNAWRSGNSGRLATITDAQDQQILNELIPGNFQSSQWSASIFEPGYYIGATDTASEGRWVWSDGQEVSSYENWARFEPNNLAQFGEDCVQVMMVDNDFYDYVTGKWIDVACTSSRFYICERTISPSLIWGYDNNPHVLAPARWAEEYPQCGGSRQSPIDINPYTIEACVGSRRRIKGWRSHPNANWNIENTGRFIKIEVTPRQTMWTALSGNAEKFYISHMILKWGDGTTKGSDHAIGGLRNVGELQVYHEADSTGHIQAFAFMIGERLNSANRNWDDLIRSIGNVQEVGLTSTMAAPGIGIKQLLGDSSASGQSVSKILRRSIRYEGSLPHPPCTENVVWTVFPDPIKLSRSQLSRLRQTHMEGGVLRMSNNFRPSQTSQASSCLVS